MPYSLPSRPTSSSGDSATMGCFLIVFDMDQQRNIEAEKQVDAHIAAIRSDIAVKKAMVQQASADEIDFYRHFEEWSKQTGPMYAFPLYKVTDGCVGCGTCTRVSPGLRASGGQKADLGLHPLYQLHGLHPGVPCKGDPVYDGEGAQPRRTLQESPHRAEGDHPGKPAAIV